MVWVAGNEQDRGVGLPYGRNRYYDPAAGRFTQEDPIGLAGGMNLYGFAGGDPVNYSDPFGLAPCTTAQTAHGWGDITTSEGAQECQSGAGAKPIVVTAEAASQWDALAFSWRNATAIRSGMRYQDIKPVELAFPAWLGGPAAGELTAESIIARFKRGSINQVFPGEMRGKTLAEIDELAKGGSKAAKTAYKLLTQARFNK